MITLKCELEKTLAEELKEFQEGLHTSWDQAFVNARPLIIKRIKELLLVKMVGWKPSDKVLVRYPFFRNIESFVDRYVLCFELEAKDLSILVQFNREKAVEVGLPSDIDSVIEHGNDLVTGFPCLTAAMEAWSTLDQPKLMQNALAGL